MSLECKAGGLSKRGSQLKVGQQVSILLAWSHALARPVDDTSDRIAGAGFNVTSAFIGFCFLAVD